MTNEDIYGAIVSLKDATEAHFRHLGTRMDRLETRMDRLETRMGRIETRLEAVETGLTEVRGDIAALWKRTG